MKSIDFYQLKKNLKKQGTLNGSPVKIALLGDSATQFFSIALKGYAIEENINLELYEAEYNQIDREIVDAHSQLHGFAPHFIILFKSSQQLLKRFYKSNSADFASDEVKHIKALCTSIRPALKSKIILLNFPEINDNVFGNYANKIPNSFLYQLRKLNYELMNLAQELKDVFICDVLSIQAQYGTDFLFDPKMYVSADMVFNLDALPVVAKAVTDIVQSISGNFKKCLVLDLDNTLWGGIIGDDGVEKIEVGDLGNGKAFTELQSWALALKNRGVILAVCSKNQEEIAREPFEKHPDMMLRMDDIAVFVANWNNKVDNIRYIRQVLNIGFDAMVFLDDNPFERNMVREAIKEITVPELPEDPVEYMPFLRKLNLFETASFTENDMERTRQYQEEAKRRELQLQFNNEEDYLKSLEMVSEVAPFNDFTIPRVAQLTQRSNQFNLRTQRYSEEQVRYFKHSPDHISFTFTLIDKFGDNGLISVLLLNKVPEGFFIDTWIMSCRVLKRGMENFVLNELVNAVRENGGYRLIGEYIPTPKNKLVERHYENLGFVQRDDLWVLDIASFRTRPHHIKKAQPSFVESNTKET